MQRIAAPKLFIAGADDTQGYGFLRPGVTRVSFAKDARAMFEASPEPKQLEIVDSDAHSSDLVGALPNQFVSDAHADVIPHTRQLIVAFIEEHA